MCKKPDLPGILFFGDNYSREDHEDLKCHEN